MKVANDVVVGVQQYGKRLWGRLVEIASIWFPPLGASGKKKAEELRRLGIKAYGDGELNQALQYFEQAVAKVPRDPTLWSDLAQVDYALGQYQGAEKGFRRALRYDHDHARALKGLAYTLQFGERDSESIYYYLRYLEKNDQDADALINLASTLHKSGDYQEALRWYGRAEKLDPRNSLLHENRGRALYALGKLDQAIPCVRRAAELDPGNARIRGFLGTLLVADGKREKALQEYQAAVELDPEDANTRLELSWLLDDFRRYEEAIRHAAQAARVFEERNDQSGLASAYGSLGWSYYGLRDLEKSVEMSRKAVELDPELYWARFNLALALLHQGRVDEAREEYRRGADYVPLASDLRFWAVDDLEAALEEHPNLPSGAEILQMLRSRYKDMLSLRGVATNSVTQERAM